MKYTSTGLPLYKALYSYLPKLDIELLELLLGEVLLV